MGLCSSAPLHPSDGSSAYRSAPSAPLSPASAAAAAAAPAAATPNARVAAASTPLRAKTAEAQASFMRRIAGKMRAGIKGVQDFKPSIEFLTIISSPSTPFYFYADALHTEVLRVVSAEFCFLHFVDEVREKVLSLYFPADDDSWKGRQRHQSQNSDWSSRSRKKKPVPVYWESALGEGLIGECASFNIEDVVLHETFKDGVDYPPGLSLKAPVTSYCTQPVRYMGDNTRIIGCITVVNKDGPVAHHDAGPFTRRDVSQLRTICLQVSDSFYRQRIQAFEDRGDSDAKALLAHYDGDHQDGKGRRTLRHSNMAERRPSLQTVMEGKDGAESGGNSETSAQDSITIASISPVSRAQVSSNRVRRGSRRGSGGGGKPTLKRTLSHSRNVASALDLLLYQWPQEQGQLQGSRGLPIPSWACPTTFARWTFQH